MIGNARREVAREPLPWVRIVVASALGTLVCVMLVLPPNLRTSIGVVALETPGLRSPAAAVFVRDFPELHFAKGVGADGAQFYAIARQPMHLRAAAPALDRPRYREQRILWPLLAWALHPSGGGRGLIVAMVALNVLAIFVGGVAAGAIAKTLRGPPEIAAMFALVPGVIMCLNLGVADGIALALALAAIAFDLRGWHRTAIVMGVMAGLTKESLLLVLVGYALSRRDRIGARLVLVPFGAVAAWWLWLRIALAGTSDKSAEFDPIHGIARSIGGWWQRGDLNTGGVVAIAVLLGYVALRRGGLRHPLGWAVAIQLGFLCTLSTAVLSIAYNSSRAVAPLIVLAGLEFVTPRANEPSPAADEVSPPREALASAR